MTGFFEKGGFNMKNGSSEDFCWPYVTVVQSSNLQGCYKLEEPLIEKYLLELLLSAEKVSESLLNMLFTPLSYCITHQHILSK